MFDDLIDNVEDTFEDIGDKLNLDKKKVFLIAAGVTAAVGLYVWWRNRTPETEYLETVVAGTSAADIGPSSGSVEDNSGVGALVDEYNETLEQLQADYNSEILDMQKLYSEQIQGVKSEYDYKLAESENNFSDQLAILNEDVAELQTEKEAAEKAVGSYDKSINYTAEIQQALSDGAGGASDKVSTLVISRAAKISSESDKAQYATDYDKNVDYMAAINKAKAEGASQQVIDTLTKQREAKIKGEQMTQYYGDLTEDR